MPLTLIGLRGSGKSSVGRLLARRLDCAFLDADDEIEQTAGRSIREIFAIKGEAVFREIEQRVMADLLGRDGIVIAAGGGAVLSSATRERLRSAGPVVYLRIDAETAAVRIAGDATTAARRPALTAFSAVEEMRSILAARSTLYEACATHVIDAQNESIEQLTERVLAAISDRGNIDVARSSTRRSRENCS